MSKPYWELEPSQFDDLPEFLKRKPGEQSPEPESVPMRKIVPMQLSLPVYTKADDAEAPAPDTEADTPADKAPAKPAKKATGKAKAKGATPVAAKGNGHAKAVKKAADKGTAKAPAKAKGEAKARHRDPAKLDAYGFRQGSIKSTAAAMYAKGKGATLAEVKAEVGSVQFNLLTELEEKGWPVESSDVKNERGRMVSRYKIGKKE